MTTNSSALWVTPLVLLPGVALLVLSTSTRYGQIHSEFHHLLDERPASARLIAGMLLRRSVLFRNALVGLYLSVGLLSVASLIGGFASLAQLNTDLVVVALSFLGIVCLVYAAVALIRESTISLHIIRAHYAEIERE